MGGFMILKNHWITLPKSTEILYHIVIRLQEGWSKR